MKNESDAVRQKDEWNREIQREKAAASYPKWPNEAMLKVLFGGSNYLEVPCKPAASWRVLDVGCGFGSNLVPFADLGCECHGIEIHPQMAATAQETMDKRGYRARFGVGSNRALPFPDAHFDLLLSINTIHYEGTEANVLAAFKEFRRVLKPGGALYLSTVAPKHSIQKRAESLGGHRYRIRDFGFRSGEEFFFFDSAEVLRDCSLRAFSTAETGRVTEELMKLPLDFFIAVCR